MLGFIRDVVGTLTSPLTGALDLAGDALGLPKVLTNSIKAAVGVATGNVMLVADGMVGVMSELTKNPPAKTEFCAPRDPVRAGEGYAPPRAPPRPETQGSHGTSAPTTSGGGILDPKTLEYRDALRQLGANFDLLEGTERALLSSKNGKVSTQTLLNASKNEKLPQGLRDACRFFMENEAYRNMLDTAGKGGKTDGTISTTDVRAALAKVNQDIARYGVRVPPRPSPPTAPAPSTPTSCTPASGGGASTPSKVGGAVRDIINNPNMSIEEKLQAILMALTANVDDELLQVMDDLAAAQDKQAGLANTPENQKALSDAKRGVEMLNLRLQNLMEKRKAMFDLMSNMSTKFNEMAKTAINNLRSA